MAVTRGLLRPTNGEGSMRSFIVIVTLICLIILVYYKTKYPLDEDSTALNSKREILHKSIKICHEQLENYKLLKESSDKERDQSLMDGRLLISNLKDEIITIKKELNEMKDSFNMCLIQQAQKQTSQSIECGAKIEEADKRYESIIMEMKQKINELNQSDRKHKKKLSNDDKKNKETENKLSNTDDIIKKTSNADETDKIISNTEKEDNEMKREKRVTPNANNLIESNVDKISEQDNPVNNGRTKLKINIKRNRKLKKKMLTSENNESQTVSPLNDRKQDMDERLNENRLRKENVVSERLNKRNSIKMHVSRSEEESVSESGGTTSKSIHKSLPNEEKDGDDKQQNNKQETNSQNKYIIQHNSQNQNSLQELNHQLNIEIKKEMNEQQQTKHQISLTTKETQGQQNNILINEHNQQQNQQNNYKEQQQYKNDQQQYQQQQLNQHQQIPQQPNQHQQITKSFNIGDQLDKYQRQLEEGNIGNLNPPQNSHVKDPEKKMDLKGGRM